MHMSEWIVLFVLPNETTIRSNNLFVSYCIVWLLLFRDTQSSKCRTQCRISSLIYYPYKNVLKERGHIPRKQNT